MLYTNGHWRQTSGCRGCRCTCCLFGLEVLKSIKDYIMTKYRDIFFIIPALIFFDITKYILLNKSQTHTPTFQARLAPMRMGITTYLNYDLKNSNCPQKRPKHKVQSNSIREVPNSSGGCLVKCDFLRSYLLLTWPAFKCI